MGEHPSTSPLRGYAQGERSIPGSLVSTNTPHGRLLQTDRLHAATARHGRIALKDARTVAGPTLARIALDASLHGVDASRLLLVDTETTGLHHGAGTLPFLIGLAWYEGDTLVVRQLFLGRPGEEPPMLRMLAELLERASLLVTFNGKSFDWPLLRTRLVMNRIKPPPMPPHLDLLHCSRRLFKRRLGGTRLQDLERHVLGFHRHDDIEGAQIPEVYFEWLRRGVTTRLERVLEHNVRDVVSMAAVLAELARLVETVSVDDAAEDCLSLAELTVRAKDLVQAESLALLAAQRAAETLTAFDAWCLAARCASQRKDWAAAAQRLSSALELTGIARERRARAHLAFSRVLEHRLKQYELALRHAELGAGAESVDDCTRRKARLSARLVNADREAISPHFL